MADRNSTRVTSEEAGDRLDLFLAHREPGESRSRLARLITRGAVLVNGANRLPSHRLRADDLVEWQLEIPLGGGDGATAEDIPLTIIYRDESIIVVDKAAGMVVHPAHGHETGTLVNALMALDPDLRIDDSARPGVVHRLDRGTSGVIVIARHDRALLNLQAQFAARAVKKRYVALVRGVPKHHQAVIDAPIGRDPRDRKKMALVAKGRTAVTRYEVREQFREVCLVDCAPETGRTHQIRVHLASIGHPIVGDSAYGSADPELGRPFLHAVSLAFTHPESGSSLTFTSPLSDDLERYLAKLRGR